ncbi:hypothetical protein B0J13DRAFT_222577 [Dactylonectria estremocensis]|uniref:Early meiotic induction protein 1 n=1 Tax=Dactylonectria estremocensis TaxID=1079267 RepID=A0A9P9J7J0_9HYPO|nr:hypothetical protein B0J13DRAFT_222577 [Dactylonectria estremocensis]
MAWLWASATPVEKAPAPANKESAPPPSVSASTSTPTPTSSLSSSSSNELSSDPEIQKFLALFDTKSQPTDQTHSATSSSSSQKPTEQSSISSWFSVRSSPSSSSRNGAEAVEAPPGDAVSESLLPTDLSCRTAFDQAWACNSMGGQWNAIYRYGEMRSCSEHWDDFWFCMRIKSYGKEMRENVIRAHHRNKNHAKYGPGKPSSEDVWQGRDEKVKVGSVFIEPID